MPFKILCLRKKNKEKNENKKLKYGIRYQLPTKSSISWTFFITLQIKLHDEFLSKIIKFLKIPMQLNND